MQRDGLVEKISALVQPIADELNYELYYVEYVKESGDNFLRIYIDKEEGHISLTDCETVSRSVSTMLDEEDPIPDSYYLEVSSPGLNRGLYNDKHYKKFIGREVAVKLTGAVNGSKSYNGILKSVDDESIVINNGEDISIPKNKIKKANLDGEI